MRDRFQGRYEAQGRVCQWPGCPEAGEFRAPGGRPAGFDGPGDYRWFCLEHVREFNSGYDFFEGMDSEEIFRAQSPTSGWERETRAFSTMAGIDGVPRWTDFDDPLDAIGERARRFKRQAEEANRPQQRSDGKPVTFEERRALDTLGLSIDAGRKELRARYAVLVRKFHPDRNGGDRRHEARLRSVVDAYEVLKKAMAFA
ncbi:MAG: J domain-containing protein [Sphingomonadaceae bacterium]